MREADLFSGRKVGVKLGMEGGDVPGRMGEWRRESGKRKETTCDRRQLLKNKHSTTHGARKARHPALRLPAVSVGFDIPLGDAGGESHAKNHPTRNLAKVTVSPLQTRSNLTASFFFSFGKLSFLLCIAQSRKLYSQLSK